MILEKFGSYIKNNKTFLKFKINWTPFQHHISKQKSQLHTDYKSVQGVKTIRLLEENTGEYLNFRVRKEFLNNNSIHSKERHKC